MKNQLARLALFALYLLPNATAVADSGNVEDILPLANDPNDPIGVERDPGLDRAAAAVSAKKPTGMTVEERARFGPTPPPFAAKSGEALTAVSTVREVTHRAALELSAGLALLEHELTLENTADKPAELEYRLAVPSDAALAGIDVCNARGCRSGQLVSAAERAAYDDAVLARGPRPALEQLPLAQAEKRRDARGTALLIRAAPVVKDRPLTLRVRYATAAPLHGGVARLSLPPRGMDPRAAALELSLRATDLLDVQSGGQSLRAGGPALRSDPWQALEIRAAAGSNAAGTRSVWQYSCGTAQCARAYASAPPRSAGAVDLVLAVDASPSTEGVARSRLVPTIAAILARAPEGSRVRALRFASKAEPLLRERADPTALSLSAFAPVTFEAELGSATRFEAAWDMLRSWGVAERGKLRRVIAIVGDGGITRGKARPFEAARRAGVEVSVVNVADRPSQPALAKGAESTGGTVIDAGSDADLAARSGSPERLEERVAALFAPVAIERPSVASFKLPALRAGESLTLEGPSRSSWTLHAGSSLRATAPPTRLALALALRGQERRATQSDAPALIAVDARDLQHGSKDRPAASGGCDRRGPALRQGGISSDAQPVALAAERAACAIPAKKPKPKDDDEDDIGSGMPSSPLLGMLRQRIIPVARACFRRDRAGRADYQVRAVFAFELAEREVVSAEVTGQITDELRGCLLAAVDDLAVPRFSGRVVVRYPLVTERETLPSQIELTPQTADRLDSVIGP